jgi:hypothetical protein
MSRASHEPTFKSLIAKYPLQFTIPETMEPELVLRGPMPSMQNDHRVSTRFRCNGHSIVECLESPKALKTEHFVGRAIIRNVSRSGISFLMNQQFYPEQVLRVYLPIAIAKVKVKRCRFVGNDCFDIGAKILEYTEES